MMLMTKFGKFKLRLIATINMSVLLSVFNLASTTSSYWLKYLDNAGESHIAGLWRSCPSKSGGLCTWKSGIIDFVHTFWSICVRLFITFGTLLNVLVILIFFMAFVYKLNKKSRVVIRLLEWGNVMLMVSFITILLGFCLFISNDCNYSMWFHVFAMIFIIITSNMITRTFATLYFQNTRLNPGTKSCETGMSHAKLALGEEEKIALATIKKEVECSTDITMSAIETNNKAGEKNGSNEALIPTASEAAPTVAATAPPIQTVADATTKATSTSTQEN